MRRLFYLLLLTNICLFNYACQKDAWTMASSGEAIAARPDTKFFGMSTCGLSTANQNINMPDGAILYLTVSTMADRTKKMYGKKVTPDVEDPNQTRYIQQAIEWLKQ
ncbi:MAG TPA: hypothetical protein VGE24_13240 [Emticicia sp.]